VLDAAIRVK